MLSEQTKKESNAPRSDSPLFTPFKSISEHFRPTKEIYLISPEISELINKRWSELAQAEDNSLLNKIRKKIPESYFTPKLFERKNEASFYEKFGIRFFKKYLPTSGDLVRRLTPMFKNSLAGGVNEVRGDSRFLSHEYFTRKNETAHLLSAAATLGFLFIPGVTITSHVCIQLINVVVNVYPVLLQRYNRARIYNALDRRLEIRQQHSVDNEKEDTAISMRRAQIEGLSVRFGKVYYKNQNSNNTLLLKDNRLARYSGLVQKIALDDQTHLYLKVNNEWINPCIALGEILKEAGVEMKRVSKF